MGKVIRRLSRGLAHGFPEPPWDESDPAPEYGPVMIGEPYGDAYRGTLNVYVSGYVRDLPELGCVGTCVGIGTCDAYGVKADADHQLMYDRCQATFRAVVYGLKTAPEGFERCSSTGGP